MKFKWPKDIQEASIIQEQFKDKVVLKPLKKLNLIAGSDVSFKGSLGKGSMCVFSYPDLKIVEEKTVILKVDFPYTSGFLSFREGRVLERVYHSLKNKPQVIVFDGQGIAHPKGLGLASFMGVILNTSTIGCAKNYLFGVYKQPSIKKGSFEFIFHPFTFQKIGVVLRSRTGVKPLFISPGNLITIEEAKNIILSCCVKFRLPEIQRRAHLISKF